MIDIVRRRQDAEYLIEQYGDDGVTGRLASDFLRILDDPMLIVPEGYALVKKPELLGLGVPSR